jgi:hypothetical protein
MGWCSGTEFFDDGLSTFLQYVPEEKKFEVVREWYDSFAYSDWDCQGESSYYEDYVKHFEVQDNGLDLRWDRVLYINRSDSRCSCGVEAFPTENGHYTAAGFVKREPCGDMWDAVSSEYVNMAEMMTRNTFGFDNLIGLPVVKYGTLEWLGMFGGKTRANAAMPKVSEEDDDTIYESEDLS